MKYIMIFVFTLSSLCGIFDYDRAINQSKKGNLEPAALQLQKLVIDSPENAQLLYDTGVIAYKNREYDQAQGYFKAAASKTKNPALRIQSLFNQANALVKLNKLREALEVYESILKQNPDHTQAKHNKEVVKKMLENQQKQDNKDNQKNEEDDQKKEKDQENKSNSDPNNEKQKQNQSNNNESDNQDNKQKNNPENNDQKQKNDESDKNNKDSQKKNDNREQLNQQKEEKKDQDSKKEHQNSSDEKAQEKESGKQNIEKNESKNSQKQSESESPSDMNQKAAPLPQYLAKLLEKQEAHEKKLQKQMIKSFANSQSGSADEEYCW